MNDTSGIKGNKKNKKTLYQLLIEKVEEYAINPDIWTDILALANEIEPYDTDQDYCYPDIQMNCSGNGGRVGRNSWYYCGGCFDGFMGPVSWKAYENLLNKFPLLNKYIIIIYGCGGNRDKTKRSQIAKTVSKYTNLQIITDDNPRSEDPVKIRKTLIKHSSNPIEVPNRRKAIKFGINYISKNKGILIIAGKGHEDTQIYKDKSYFFNDKLISSNYAKNL